ncbi:MAG: hypothetical protein LBI91_00485 [Spirochaetaceae bacterium]|jgi:hypothetical protein|nr:hypothetical protein [Spirochaetaceae bacterium]
MIKTKRFLAVTLFLAAGLALPGAKAQDISGVLDSRLSLAALSGKGDGFSWGFEEAANVRLQAKLRDSAAFYSAVNLIAAAGSFARNAAGMGASMLAAAEADGGGLAPSAFVSGANYLGALELERLYFRISGDYAGFDAGLMRIAFGYGQVWSPSDFLNPRNPLLPDARPRAVLGAAFMAYPLDDAKVQVFGAAPENPLNAGGGGAIFGLSAENHWERVSAQLLCAYETPQENYAAGPAAQDSPAGGNNGSEYGVHRWGLSLKADLALGLVADALFTWKPGAGIGAAGLSAGAGFDYSFADGNCYALLEYLFNGSESSTSKASDPLTGFSNRNYLYALFRYSIGDYSSASLGCIASLDDLSFTPVAGFERELFQGFTLSLSAQLPLDRDALARDGKRGELGPLPPGVSQGNRFIFTAKARLRF